MDEPDEARIGAPWPHNGNLEEYVPRLELAATENSLKKLTTFPCVRILVERGKLQLHGACFGAATGVLLVRDPGTGEFKRAVDDVPKRVCMFSARSAD
jgi:carbonic anhydrase